MTKTIILISLVLFNGCRVPKLEPQIRIIYSEKFRECRCQYYDYMSLKAQENPISCDEFYKRYFPEEPTKHELDYCEGLTGNSPKVWGEKIKPWIFRLIETIKDQND